MVAVAAEQTRGGGLGRAHLRVVDDASAYSTPSRTPIPRQAEHRFHAKPNTDSMARRTPIPWQGEQ
jgi:hypothetical protein